MPAIRFRYGAPYLTVRYVQWRDGLAFFRRRIPADLQRYYPGKKEFIFQSLQTRDATEAAKLAHREAQKLDLQEAPPQRPSDAS